MLNEQIDRRSASEFWPDQKNQKVDVDARFAFDRRCTHTMELDTNNNTKEPHPDVSIRYDVHPRVILRISDHYTRVKASGRMEIESAESAGRTPPGASTSSSSVCYTAVGCLLGEQQGRVVEIVNSFDLPAVDFDWAVFETKVELYKEMYPTIEVVGWYVTMPKDAELGAEHVGLHNRLAAAENGCPSPVVMAYDPRSGSSARGDDGVNPANHRAKATENAVRLFEGEEHDNRTVFRLAKHEMHSTDVERIVVNQFSDLLDASDDATANKTSAAMKNHQEYLRSAVMALIERVTRLQRVLVGIKEGRLEYDDKVVMAIAAFVDRLPLSEDGMSLARSSRASEGLVEEQKDALLKTLIASTMAGLASLETHASFDARKLFAQEERGGKHGHHLGGAKFMIGERPLH